MLTSPAHKSYQKLKTLRRVFFRPVYSLTAIVSGSVLLASLSIFPHRALLWVAVTSSSLSISEKVDFVKSILVLLGANMSSVSMVLSIVVAVLFGVQVALLLYYVRRRRTGSKSSVKVQATSIGGLVAALFGIGCAACGSVIATTVLGLVGAGGLLVALPLQGLEFGILGIVLLLFSIVYLLNRINDPLVCDVA